MCNDWKRIPDDEHLPNEVELEFQSLDGGAYKVRLVPTEPELAFVSYEEERETWYVNFREKCADLIRVSGVTEGGGSMIPANCYYNLTIGRDTNIEFWSDDKAPFRIDRLKL